MATADLIDKKAIGRPNILSGIDTGFNDWSFQLITYLGYLLPTLPDMMKLAENHLAAMDQSALTAEWRQVSNQLLHIMSMLTKKKTL